MKQIETTTSNGVMRVVFNRPQRKNALTAEMYADLCDALDAATSRPEVRVLLFAGAEGVFSSGNDLDDFIDHPPSNASAPVCRFLRKLASFPKPVVAAVEGLAIGVGTTLLLHCDLVYAAEDTQFALPFVTLGLVPEAASSLLLARVAGYQWASEKLLFGDAFPASEAKAMGIVNRLLSREEVLPFAIGQAERLSALPAGSVRGTKALMKAASARATNDGDSWILDCMEREFEQFAERLDGPAAREAIAAFKEGRKPDYAGIE